MATPNKPHVEQALVDYLLAVFPDRSPDYSDLDLPTMEGAATTALLRSGEQRVIRKLASILKEQRTP